MGEGKITTIFRPMAYVGVPWSNDLDQGQISKFSMVLVKFFDHQPWEKIPRRYGYGQCPPPPLKL